MTNVDDNATERQTQISFNNEMKYIDPDCFNDDIDEVKINFYKMKYEICSFIVYLRINKIIKKD